MIDTQLGRRNLTPIQRIAIAEKYRPIIEKKAKENQSVFKGNQYTNGTCQNSDKKQIKKVDTKKELKEFKEKSLGELLQGDIKQFNKLISYKEIIDSEIEIRE